MSLEERVAKLEARLEDDKKSFVRRFSIWAGVIALAISILSGSYNLFDQFYFRPQREKEEDLQLLRNIVSRLSEINWRLVEIQVEGDQELSRFVGMVANGEKASLLAKADKIVSKYPQEVDFSEYIVLAQEHLNWSNSKTALTYANAALKTAGNEIFEIEAYRYKARALFNSGLEENINMAADVLADTVKKVKALGGYRMPALLVSVYMDWILGEVYFGNCQKANEQYEKLLSEYELLKMSKQATAVMVQGINRSVAEQSRCMLNARLDTANGSVN